MIRYRSIFFLLIPFLISACRSAGSFSSTIYRSLHDGKAFIAWNEDTVSCYQFLGMIKEKKFYYTINETVNSQKVELYYKGTLRYANDTIFLVYHKGRQPAGVANYLIKEGSGQYLIQPFTKDKKRVFFRLMSQDGHGNRNFFDLLQVCNL